ncbi:hypothetical protein JCM5350_005377 [Sporobolomyces pararoseus]
MVEITLTSRDGVYEVVTARDGVLGGLQLVVNLDLGDWRELLKVIIYVNKKSTRVESMVNSLERDGIDEFGKTTLKVRSESTRETCYHSCNNKIYFTGIWELVDIE